MLGDSGDTLRLKAGHGAWEVVTSDVGLGGSAGGGFDLYAYAISGTRHGFIAVDSDVTAMLL